MVNSIIKPLSCELVKALPSFIVSGNSSELVIIKKLKLRTITRFGYKRRTKYILVGVLRRHETDVHKIIFLSYGASRTFNVFDPNDFNISEIIRCITRTYKINKNRFMEHPNLFYPVKSNTINGIVYRFVDKHSHQYTAMNASSMQAYRRLRQT